MGLDMYLTGRRFNPQHKYVDGEYKPHQRPIIDGFPVEENLLAMGYWRKHHHLHGYIVKHFANGEDDCQPIELAPDDLNKIADVLERFADDPEALPATEGFFFGHNIEGWTDELRAEAKTDASVFRVAAKWCERPDIECWKSVEYRASW